MTPQELAILGFEYLTGKSSPLNPSTKDDIITSSTLEGMEGSSFKYFAEKLENESVSEYDKESNIGDAEASVTHDVIYGFSIDDNDNMALIINMTDTYKSTYKKGDAPYTELLNREINSVIVDSDGIEEIDMSAINDLINDYAPIHQRVFDGFGTRNWVYVFKWDGLQKFKEQEYKQWSNYRASQQQVDASLPPFARFQRDAKKQLTQYLIDNKSVDFITTFVEQQLDTAHLYGINEKRK